MIKEHTVDDIFVVEYTDIEVLDNLRGIINRLDNEVAANEGLIRILSDILDSIMGIFTNLLTQVTKFTKLVKQSELKAYVQSNRLNVRRLNKLNYTDIRKIEIPEITGMKCNYPLFSKNMAELVTSLDVEHTAKVGVQSYKNMLEHISNDNMSNIVTNITELKTVFNNDFLTKKDKMLRSIFDAKEQKVKDVPFFEHFNSMGEFVDIVEETIEVSNIYDDIKNATKSLEKMTLYLDKIIAILEDGEVKVDKKALKELHSMAYTTASTFEMYGRIVVIYNRLEHHLTMIYKELDKKIK